MQRLTVAIVAALLMLPVQASAQGEAILIFGGSEHKEFLGCLNCAESDAKSVWNTTSRFGWANNYGVWGEYGQNGGAYGSNSACNEYTSTPPILVDRQGNSYGYLTVNEYKSGSVCGASGSEQICRALKVMCAHAD